MYADLFQEFLAGDNTLRVYKDGKLIFSSNKDRLIPLLEYIASPGRHHQQVTVFDKITGNAAVLLAVKANCQEVYSPLGSELAIKTLNKYGIRYHFTATVHHIKKPDGKSMCPMEQLSLDKEPEVFYEIIRGLLIDQNAERAGAKEATWTG
jgi:hypothetical protein